MNDEGTILVTQLHEQNLQLDCPKTGPQDGDYNDEKYELGEDFQDIKIVDCGTYLNTTPPEPGQSHWGTSTSQYPAPPINEGVFENDDGSGQLAYTFQVNVPVDSTTQNFLFVVFVDTTQGGDPTPTGIWLGTSSGVTLPKGYRAYKPAKPQA